MSGQPALPAALSGVTENAGAAETFSSSAGIRQVIFVVRSIRRSASVIFGCVRSRVASTLPSGPSVTFSA